MNGTHNGGHSVTDKLVFTKKGLAHTFGWLRRPDYDTVTTLPNGDKVNNQIWEDCDGGLHYVTEGQDPIVGESIQNGKKVRKFFIS